MKMLSRSTKRIIAAAILGIILLLLDGYLVSPIISYWTSQKDYVEMLTLKLSRYNSLLASRDDMERQNKKLESHLFATGALRKGNTPAMVSAEIQSQIRQIVGGLGGTVLSTVDLPHDNRKSPDRIGIHVNCEGELSLIVGVLAASEKEKPLLFIDNLSIRAPDLTQSKETLEKLALGFDAYGYILGDTP